MGFVTMISNDSVYIIAEAGVNHNGRMALARKLVDAAHTAGADAVKFQCFRADLLAQEGLAKETYQIETSGGRETQYEMLKRLELSRPQLSGLKEYARARGIEFLCTPYDPESADFLDNLGIPLFKIGSGELTDTPFLEYVARKGRPVILSTGASTLDEVKEAVKAVRSVNSSLTLLHCTSNYPAAPGDVNLLAMLTLKREFECPVGYSDHTPGIAVAAAAAALGARVIEKHFTLDRGLPGPDHKASLEPGDFARMVAAVREVEAALGSAEKKPCACEQETILMGRRSILARIPIRSGQIITPQMLVAKRPGIGIPPKEMPRLIGRRAVRDIVRVALLSWEDLEDNGK